MPLRNVSWYQSVICFLAHSFLVGDDGRVYEGVGWNIQGSHDQGYNNISLGIAFFGAQEGNGTSADCPSKGSLLLSLEALLPSQASPQSQFLLHFFSLGFQDTRCDTLLPFAEAPFSGSAAFLPQTPRLLWASHVPLFSPISICRSLFCFS